MTAPLPSNPVTDERLRNTRAWAAARIGQLSGAEVIVAACDEALAARVPPEATGKPAFVMPPDMADQLKRMGLWNDQYSVLPELARTTVEPPQPSEARTDQVECLRGWAKAVERGECAKETIIDALLMAADSIEHMEREASDEPPAVQCNDCQDTGQVCVGTSGSDADGNGPVMERCPSCGDGEPDESWITEARELFRQTTFDDGAISMAEWERRRDALLVRPARGDRLCIDCMELKNALAAAVGVANEAREMHDRDQDSRTMKLLLALSGHLPKYRSDTDRIHDVLRHAVDRLGSTKQATPEPREPIGEIKSIHGRFPVYASAPPSAQRLQPLPPGHEYDGTKVMDDAGCIHCGYNPWKHKFVECIRSTKSGSPGNGG